MTHREFVDSDRVAWTVWEIRRRDPARLPQVLESLNRGWLAFQCLGERRRLAPVPEAWQGLSDAELESLCRRAQLTSYRR